MNIIFKKPIKGQYLNVEEAEDEVFSQKLLGPGFLIKPKDKNIYAPTHGKIKMVYPTLHAIAISLEDLDILIHVGLTDKIRTKNQYTLHVDVNQVVNPGDLLLSFNFNFADFDENDYAIPVVFVQKKELTIIKEDEDYIKLSIS